MINGSHVIIYAEDAERVRAFFRDVLGWPHVDAHDGWLIFRLPPAELGVHPDGPPPSLQSGTHQLWLMCDDLPATIDELTAKGVEFVSGIEEAGFGRITSLRVPGGGQVGLYQPRHPTAYDLPG